LQPHRHMFFTEVFGPHEPPERCSKSRGAASRH
jgi:hypothetical protein